MPSIAVTRTDIPHTNFGEITLVMDKSTVDPKANRKNTVYSADAWTPTFPRVEYEADPGVDDRIRKPSFQICEELKGGKYLVKQGVVIAVHEQHGLWALLRRRRCWGLDLGSLRCLCSVVELHRWVRYIVGKT